MQNKTKPREQYSLMFSNYEETVGKQQRRSTNNLFKVRIQRKIKWVLLNIEDHIFDHLGQIWGHLSQPEGWWWEYVIFVGKK